MIGQAISTTRSVRVDKSDSLFCQKQYLKLYGSRTLDDTGNWIRTFNIQYLPGPQKIC